MYVGHCGTLWTSQFTKKSHNIVKVRPNWKFPTFVHTARYLHVLDIS